MQTSEVCALFIHSIYYILRTWSVKILVIMIYIVNKGNKQCVDFLILHLFKNIFYTLLLIIDLFVHMQTILLQDKQKKNYCVACQELDSDIDKDNPGMLVRFSVSGLLNA